MHKKHYSVIFEPQGRICHVIEGTKLIEAVTRTGYNVCMPCGGIGTCGKCRIQILKGAAKPNGAEKEVFTNEELERGWRLACQTIVEQNMVAQIPQSSFLSSEHKILTESGSLSAKDVTPAVYKKFIKLTPPSLSDNRSDLVRLCESTGNCKIDLKLLRKLPDFLRINGFEGTAVLADHVLIDFEAGDTRDHCYGIAFDVGTTTVVGTLLELSSGRELAIASRMNPQAAYGDDVLSRINHCSQTSEGMQHIQESILNCINEMIGSLCSESNIKANHVYEVSIAGNTTMEHIFCGINPKPLGEVPFVSAFSRGLMLPATDLSVPINSRGRVYVFPIIGGFVGGDTTACILSSELWKNNGSSLMVDIGTNGEIVLANNGKSWAASAAAGPALEGARISCGMRATTGAIEKILFNDDVEYSVIGEVEPIGICGSALIDIMAELLRFGIVQNTGQMLLADQISADIPETLKSRIIADKNGQPEFLIAKGSNDRKITITHKDVRELQLAVGAIRAGIEIMLNKAGIEIENLERILLAGGFGSYIRKENAKRIGLLPTQAKNDSIVYIGNASLAGSKWALLNTEARKQAEKIAQNTEHVELSLDPEFQMKFSEAMIFPSEN